MSGWEAIALEETGADTEPSSPVICSKILAWRYLVRYLSEALRERWTATSLLWLRATCKGSYKDMNIEMKLHSVHSSNHTLS